jgi:hypothetical protein
MSGDTYLLRAERLGDIVVHPQKGPKLGIPTFMWNPLNRETFAA